MYMNFTNMFPTLYINDFVLENQLFICLCVCLSVFFYILLLQNEIDDLHFELENMDSALENQQHNGSFTNEMLCSFKDLEKRLNKFHTRLNVFHTRVKTMIQKVVEGFNKEQEKLKSQMDEKEHLYNLNIKTILQLSRNPYELYRYLESIGYKYNEVDEVNELYNNSVEEDQDDAVSICQDSEEEDPEEEDQNGDPSYYSQGESDTEVVIRKRPRREVAPVSFKKFFTDTDSDDSGVNY